MPNQPGSTWRLCIQAYTQGTGRTDPTPSPSRWATRPPICMRSITSIGVASRKNCVNPGWPCTSPR